MSGFVFREPAKIIADVLQTELGLDEGRVMLSNQKINIPTDGLFVVVSYVGPGRVIACNSDTTDAGAAGLLEIQTVNVLNMVQIDIMSFGNEARTRKDEIAMALRSVYSQQQQEKFSMQIARQPGAMMDTSYLEGTQILSCYTTTIVTTSLNRKEKSVDFFDTFRGADLYTDPKTAGQPIKVPPVAAA